MILERLPFYQVVSAKMVVKNFNSRFKAGLISRMATKSRKTTTQRTLRTKTTVNENQMTRPMPMMMM